MKRRDFRWPPARWGCFPDRPARAPDAGRARRAFDYASARQARASRCAGQQGEGDRVLHGSACQHCKTPSGHAAGLDQAATPRWPSACSRLQAGCSRSRITRARGHGRRRPAQGLCRHPQQRQGHSRASNRSLGWAAANGSTGQVHRAMQSLQRREQIQRQAAAGHFWSGRCAASASRGAGMVSDLMKTWSVPCRSPTT